MHSIVSLISRLSSINSQDYIESEQNIEKQTIVPSLKTPFEYDRLNNRKEISSENNCLKVQLCNMLLTSQSQQLENLSEQLIELDLSNNLLHIIPIQLRKYQNIRYLNLSNNQIQQIPQKLPFQQLQILNLSENQIRNIPSSLCKITTLKEINLNNNLIEIINSELFELKLNKLCLRANLFTTIPPQFYIILQTLTMFDCDWLDQCGLQTILDSNLKQKLFQIGKRAQERNELITFSLFYYNLTNKVFDIQAKSISGQSILFRFILRDSIGLLRYYCQKHQELCYINDQDDVSPLQFAQNLQRIRCLQYLIPFYNQQSKIIKNFFLISIKKLDLQSVKLLLNYGIDVNCQNDTDIITINKIIIPKCSTPLQIAMTSFGRNVHQQQQAQMMLLLENGSDPNIRNLMKLTSLHCAVKLPSLAAVKYASTVSKFDFKKRDQNKNTPLHSAASMGLVSILQIIQAKLVNPFSLNINNKTAKQVSISSLQIIKLQRKYEIQYLRKKFYLENDDNKNTQKNDNFNAMSSFQTFSQLQTDQKSIQMQSPQSQKRLFRLNLSQVKLMEQQIGQQQQYSGRSQLSSQRSIVSTMNQTLSLIQKIIRQNQNSNKLFQEMKILYKQTEILQEKLLIISFINLIIMRIKFQWKYKQSISIPTIQILNESKISYEKPENCYSYYLYDDENISIFYHYLCGKMFDIDDTLCPQFLILKNQLSINVKYNIANNWKESIKQQENNQQQIIGMTQWINGIKGLKIQFNNEITNSNRLLLFDYEKFHNNCFIKTQFIKIIKNNYDYYKEQKVDNSESKGNLSDRISQYQKPTIINKGVLIQKFRLHNLPNQKKSNKLELYYKNISQTTRKASPQISQHLGEKTAQTFRQESKDYEDSNDFFLNNL